MSEGSVVKVSHKYVSQKYVQCSNVKSMHSESEYDQKILTK